MKGSEWILEDARCFQEPSFCFVLACWITQDFSFPTPTGINLSGDFFYDGPDLQLIIRVQSFLDLPVLTGFCIWPSRERNCPRKRHICADWDIFRTSHLHHQQQKDAFVSWLMVLNVKNGCVGIWCVYRVYTEDCKECVGCTRSGREAGKESQTTAPSVCVWAKKPHMNSDLHMKSVPS